MESLQNLKKRIGSVHNVGQITKAMELVSATKMRKAQQIAIDSRPYALVALELLANISVAGGKLPELLKIRKEIKKVLFVLVASDKGLAGSFNSSIFKKFEAHQKIEKDAWKKEEHLYVAIGEKANTYLLKKSLKVVKKFTQVGDYINIQQVKPIVDFIAQGYLEKKWDRVIVISTHFRSALKQEPHVRRILPVDFDHIATTIKEIVPERGKFAELIKENNINFVPDKSKIKDYIIEPSPAKVLEKLASHLFFMQMYHIILEANASEHSARRVAMKMASDNAFELGQDLTLQYNKLRQADITNKIIEIISGAESLQ